MPLEEAILKTLAYSDIFDYPLTFDELHKYLTMSVTKEELKQCIEKMNHINFNENYFYLVGRDEIVQTRKRRALKSTKIFKRAMFYGKIIGKFPFVRMVALTGSLAMLNLSNEIDMDFMLITKSNRLWLARALAVTFGRFIRLLGDRICINLLISENALHWKDHDLYSAREICQMIPISGFATHNNFRVANLWTREFLPNSFIMESTSLLVDMERQASPFQKQKQASALQKLESLAMNIQLKIISRRTNPSDETNFTADVCQGNFHQHKRWTHIEYEKRLQAMSVRAAFVAAKQSPT
jgi:hypothetical protein